VHALLIGFSCCVVLVGWTPSGRKRINRTLCSPRLLAYVLTAAVTFLAFSLLYSGRSSQPLPHAVLRAVRPRDWPGAGRSIPSIRLLGEWFSADRGCNPIPFFHRIATLIPLPDHALVGSVLQESPRRLLLANGLYLIKPYEDLTNRIKDVKCFQVGLMLHGGQQNTPVGLPGPAAQAAPVEWITTGPAHALPVRIFNLAL